MTRLSVPSEDVLGENYKITNITASNYNPTIDSTITVTITVKDVYGDEIEKDYVTITCNVGKFTKLNGSTISDTQSVTAQTDSNGEISLTYTCSEWGLVTFSANNEKVQASVSGWKQITTYLSDRVTLYCDGRNGYITVDGTFSWSADAGVHDLVTVDSAYYPKKNATTNYDPSSRLLMPVCIYSNGSLKVNKAQTSGSSLTVICSIYYPLATPFY